MKYDYISASSVVNILLLTEFTEVDEDVVRSWDQEQRAEAFDWALAEHLSASDNENVKRLPKPAHVKAAEEPAENGWTLKLVKKEPG